MAQLNYDLTGVATQTELGKNGTVLDASRLIERRGQNIGLANNYVQLPLELAFGASVDIFVCDVGGGTNSLAHVYFDLLVSSAGGRADVHVIRTYYRTAVGVAVHSTQVNTSVSTWGASLSLTQNFVGQNVYWTMSNATGAPVRYGVGLIVHRYDLAI